MSQQVSAENAKLILARQQTKLSLAEPNLLGTSHQVIKRQTVQLAESVVYVNTVLLDIRAGES